MQQSWFRAMLLYSFLMRYNVQSFVRTSSPIRFNSLRRKLATTSTTTTITDVILKRSPQSKAFRNGSQLVFTKALIQQPSNTTIMNSSLVRVSVEGPSQQNAQPIGYGMYNPNSLYKIRILCHKYLQQHLYQTIDTMNNNDTVSMLTTILQHNLRMAVLKRQALNLPNESTNTYRVVHGEGDHLSGLAIDVIDSVVVIMSSAVWCQTYQTTITQVVQDHWPNHKIVWKTTPSRLAQDGYINEYEEESEETDGPGKGIVISKENGILYQTFPSSKGQKTGVYCDQRENRYYVAQFCKNKRVLDLCCYHGGFSLNAAIHGGAAQCTGVDSSAEAIRICQENAKLNDCTYRCEFVCDDITSYLQSSTQEYDVVILDPPKLAPTAASLVKAQRKYHALNRDAIKCVSKENGGILLSCTCSAAMTQKDGGQYFLETVHGAALAAGRQVTLLRVSGAASCHVQAPCSWPGGSYLTAAIFYVHPNKA